MDFSNFNPAEQAFMERSMAKKQMQDFLQMYSRLTENCFMTCCNDFTSKALSSKEDTCISNCTEKFIKHTERIGARFAELNAEAAAAAAASQR